MTPDDLRRYLPFLIGVPVFLVLMIWRLRMLSTQRRLRIEWLWVTPAIFAVLAVISLAPSPPTGLGWAWVALALVIGVALGWYRGKMIRIAVDPQTHGISSQASPAAIVFIVLWIITKMGVQFVAQSQAQTWGLTPALISALFVVLAFGLFGMARVEMFIRAQRLLGEARTASASGA